MPDTTSKQMTPHCVEKDSSISLVTLARNDLHLCLLDMRKYVNFIIGCYKLGKSSLREVGASHASSFRKKELQEQETVMKTSQVNVMS